MKINTIKPILTRCAVWTAIIGAWATTSYTSYYGIEKAADKRIEAQKYLRENAPKKYIQLVQENVIGYKRWEEAAQEVKDSIRMDSIARTNYALGLHSAKKNLNDK